MPLRGGTIAIVGALTFAGCSVLTSGVLDDKEPTPTSATGGGGEGGMAPVVPCDTPDECPGLDTTCRYRICEGGECDFANAPSGVGCIENEGLFCNEEGACVQCLDDDDCAGTDSCVAGICAPVHCTDSERNEGETDVDCGGTCPPCDDGDDCVESDDCTSGFCNAGTCAACGNDGDCEDNLGTFCDGGVCAPQKLEGDQCFGNTECASGVCADQVCCDGDCADCMGCRVGLTGAPNGSCAPMLIDTDPNDICEAKPVSSCGTTGACDGSGDCAYHPMGAVCSTASCTSGTETYDGTCTGPGDCSAGMPMPCDAYACDTSACFDSCQDNVECASGNACVGTQCRTCGMSAPGVGGACPSACSSCNGDVCTIECDGGSSGPCVMNGANCPPGWNCIVNCTGAQTCKTAAVNCPSTGHSCEVNCIPASGNQACEQAVISCGGGPCSLNCGGDQGCLNTTFNCGNNRCEPSCNGYSVTVNDSGDSCDYLPSGC